MQPAIHQGDAVVLSKAGPTSIVVGDVVSYQDPGHGGVVLSHRVVAVDAYTGRLVTKGDANLHADKPTTTLNVVGKVGYVIPKAGKLLDWLHSWWGMAGLVYIPALLVVAYELRLLTMRYAKPTYVVRGRTINMYSVKNRL